MPIISVEIMKTIDKKETQKKKTKEKQTNTQKAAKGTEAVAKW